jgi:hypothetical protein
MAAEKYAYGIASVEYGTPTGTATMPGSVTQWAQTVEGSFTLSEDESQTKDFKVEEVTTPVKSIVTEAGSLKIKWRAYDITPSLVAIMKGGTAGTEAGPPAYLTYDGPTSVAAKDLALRITTTNGVIFNIYKAACVGRFDGSLSRTDLLEMEVSATVLDPGNAGSPYEIKLPNPS